MGTDIHTLAQRKVDDEWIDLDFCPFDWRQYGLFGFLAGVRNYSAVPVISEPRGLPEDFKDNSEWSRWDGLHSTSWLTMDELNAFDYDAPMEDRRVVVQVDERTRSGAETANPGEGEQTTFRVFLGEGFFEDLDKLTSLGAERVIFGFDT